MLHRNTLLAFGLGSLLALGAASPAVAGPGGLGEHRYERGTALERPAALKTHHRHQRRHFKRRHPRHERRSYRRDYRHRPSHPRSRPRYNYHYHYGGDDFASGLLFGGILGYVIGNDY